MTCVKVKRIGNHTLPLPRYETEGAAGFDLRACIDNTIGGVVLYGVGMPKVVGCGFAFEVPEGYELQIRPRSGLSRDGVHVALGTVDSDYRGEVKICLSVEGSNQFWINHGDRIAQGIIAPVVRAELVEVDTLSETARGAGGFGSTGTGAGEVAT